MPIYGCIFPSDPPGKVLNFDSPSNGMEWNSIKSLPAALLCLRTSRNSSSRLLLLFIKQHLIPVVTHYAAMPRVELMEVGIRMAE